MRQHAYLGLMFALVVGACGTGAGCMVVCGGGYKSRFRVAIENGSILHFWFVLGFCFCSAHWRWFCGGVVQEQVKVQVQAGGRERFQRCGMLHAPVLQLGPMLALVVEPKAYVVRGWDGTGAGSGSKHPAVTVLGGVWFLLLKPSCGNMHTWSYVCVGCGGVRYRSRFRFRMRGLLYNVVFLLFWLVLVFCFCGALWAPDFLFPVPFPCVFFSRIVAFCSRRCFWFPRVFFCSRV